MQKSIFIFLALLIFSIMSCSKNINFQYKVNKDLFEEISKNEKIDFPETRFAVLSDLHYYNKTLGTTGTEFRKYLENDRKLLVENEEILSSAVDSIVREKCDFVIVSGDITKDGEKINHEKVKEYLKKIKDSGKKVLVINGNHDILNGDSFKYTETGKEKVETIDGKDFPEIYADFGYNDAVEKDPDSLSYVAEPVKGLWVLALDSCLWRKNKPDHHPVTGGKFKNETLLWIENILIKAVKQKKAVIGFMHHGILEHYKYNKRYYRNYVVLDDEQISQMFAFYGLHFVFTGHYHAQSVAYKKFDKSYIFDIETGSMVTSPCPFRIIEINKNQKMKIDSFFVTTIPSHPSDFKEYAKKTALKGTEVLVKNIFKKIRIKGKDADFLSPQIASAYVAHLAGDAKPPVKVLKTDEAGFLSFIVISAQKDLIEGWWNGVPPHKDNFLTIDIKTGTVE